MINYVLHLTLCSGFFFVIYLCVLQNERMHKFNRFYLLFSLLASLIIPTLSISSEIDIIQKTESMVFTQTPSLNHTVSVNSQNSVENVNVTTILFIFYVLISIILVLRILFLNWLMVRKILKGEVINSNGVNFILLNDSQTIHSYLNYIFISKSDYSKGIEKAIIEHELAHISQKHTLDILFVELLIAILWFNPLLYFYRGAIRLNHEFLADSAAMKLDKNLIQYVELILNQVSKANGIAPNNTLTSSFNYLITKKRLVMMTKKYNKKRMLFKQLSMIPVFLIGTLLFSENAMTQDVGDEIEEKQAEQNQETDIDQELQTSFDNILNKYLKVNSHGMVNISFNVTANDEERLRAIYFKMAIEQQEQQKIKFEKRRYPRNTPNEDEFEQWKDPKTYGIWIDHKRVSNDQLNNYSPKDFANYFVSKLEKNAINYGKHLYQLDLMTNEAFEKYNSSQLLVMSPNLVKK